MLPTPAADVESAAMPFGLLTIAFDRRVLRPRQWTVAHSRWAAELLRDASADASVLELCAGTGHIGLLTLALAQRDQRLVAVDLNPVACEFARRNSVAAGMSTRVEVREGLVESVLAPEERFDLVIADPPWVPRSEIGRFPDDPVIAIDGGADGLDIARSCIATCDRHLTDGGSAVFQLGSRAQVDRLRDHLRSSGSVLTIQATRSFGHRGVLVHLKADTR